MSVTKPFLAARRTLGLSDSGPLEPAAIKRAYRQRTLEHPPDRDPEAFRLVRDAYELLSDPQSRARALLLRQFPAVPPPAVPEVAQPRAAGARALLRLMAAGLDAETLLASAPVPAKRARSSDPSGTSA